MRSTPIDRNRHPAQLRSLLLVAILGSIAGGGLSARIQGAETKEYAYLLIQGKIADPLDREPLTQATLRLASPRRTFETVTDQNGVFVFDRIPVASYTLTVITRDGRVIRGIQPPNSREAQPARLKIQLGSGDPREVRLTTKGEDVVFEVPEPSANKSRVWKQLAIFAGAAAILAAGN